MMDEAPITDTGSASPESSAPVTDTPSAAPSSAATSSAPRPSRGRNGSRKSAPASVDDRFNDSMTAAYERASNGDVAPTVTPTQPDPAQLYGQLDSAINDLASGF